VCSLAPLLLADPSLELFHNIAITHLKQLDKTKQTTTDVRSLTIRELLTSPVPLLLNLDELTCEVGLFPVHRNDALPDIVNDSRR